MELKNLILDKGISLFLIDWRHFFILQYSWFFIWIVNTMQKLIFFNSEMNIYKLIIKSFVDIYLFKEINLC